MGYGGWQCPSLAQGYPACPIPVGCWTPCESPLPGDSGGPGATRAVVSLTNGSEEPAGMSLAGKGAFPLEPVTRGTAGMALARGSVPAPRSPWLYWAAVAPQGTPLSLPCHLFIPSGMWTVAPGRVGLVCVWLPALLCLLPPLSSDDPEGGTWGQMLQNGLGKLPCQPFLWYPDPKPRHP